MAESFFDKLQAKAFRAGIAPNSREASEWFFERIKNMRSGRFNREQLLKDSALRRRGKTLIGRMYFFQYDPKHKETLPYYDTFPLIFMVGPAEKGFYGINLHYLSPVLRVQLMEELMKIASNRAYDETTKLKISYELLNGSQKYKEFAPCFNHYLARHMKSRPVEVLASEWEIAALLPVHQFKKAKASRVWNDSRKIARGK